MVANLDFSCSYCHMLGDLRVPIANMWRLVINGEEGVYDLCARHEEQIIAPLAQIKAAGFVRATRIAEKLPDGWVTDTGIPGVTMPTNGNLLVLESGDRKDQAFKSYLCPAVARCKHKGFTSNSGVAAHFTVEHPETTIGDLMERVRLCGLCDPPALTNGPTALGQHATRVHRDDLPTNVKTGYGLALITEVRRDGDRHGTLSELDTYVMSLAGGETPTGSRESAAAGAR